MKKYENSKNLIAALFRNFIIWIFGLILLTPLFWMIVASLKKDDLEVYSFPIKWIPEDPTLNAYKYIFSHVRYVNFPAALLNSTIVVVIVTIGSFITCVFAAYAFSKMQFKGRNKIFLLIIISMVIPGEMLFIPQFVIYQSLHLVDTLPVLMIGGIFVNAFGIFLIRQSFASIPDDLINSAKIDGASHLIIIKNIMVPLGKESIITFLLLQFTWVWNDYQGPLLWITSKKNYTATIALSMLRSTSDSGTPVAMAGSVLSIVPVIILFIVFQKYFEESVISTGIKG